MICKESPKIKAPGLFRVHVFSCTTCGEIEAFPGVGLDAARVTPEHVSVFVIKRFADFV